MENLEKVCTGGRKTSKTIPIEKIYDFFKEPSNTEDPQMDEMLKCLLIESAERHEKKINANPALKDVELSEEVSRDIKAKIIKANFGK